MTMDMLEEIRARLPDFKYSDYLRNLEAVEKAGGAAAPLRIAVLRSYTVEAIEPVLKLRLRLEGFDAELFFGGYNQFMQEMLDESNAFYAFRPDVVLLMIRAEELMPDFIDSFGDQPSPHWAAQIESKAGEVSDLIGLVQSRMPVQFVVQNLTVPDPAYWGIYDAQNPGGQTYLIAEFNRALAERLADRPAAFIWDFDTLVRRMGNGQIFDPKMWYYSKNPYKQAAYPDLVDDLLRYLLSILGRSKKCVVVDLDNTLWGGIVGEDGLEGIRLGHTYPGSCFREFQKRLLRLYHRGVILAINSKNNEADALEVIDSHPDMVLRRKHFSAIQINWRDKAENLRALANALNIGLDSMVMVDDNPVECEQIRQFLPECRVICLPEQPYLIPGVVDSLPGLDNIRLTDEDKGKGAMYQAQIARGEAEQSYGNVEDFLESLELEVAIDAAVPYSVPRIAQLTQKTNQMNLTTRRYTEADINAMIGDPDKFVFSVSSTDRFGDNGIVGVVILEADRNECRVDTFLLSCRVIGRRIENAMMAFVADFAKDNGARTLIGEFVPTAKNAPAMGMYEGFGFEPLDETRFSADLERWTLSAPSHIRVVLDRGFAARS